MALESVSVEPLGVAAAKALRAHHLLGRLAACESLAEFAMTATELVTLTRAVSQMIARIRDAQVPQHPLETQLPTLYAARLARGSDPPPFDGVSAAISSEPQQFFFEGLDKRSAIELCADYLDRVTKLLDEARSTLCR